MNIRPIRKPRQSLDAIRRFDAIIEEAKIHQLAGVLVVSLLLKSEHGERTLDVKGCGPFLGQFIQSLNLVDWHNVEQSKCRVWIDPATQRITAVAGFLGKIVEVPK